MSSLDKDKLNNPEIPEEKVPEPVDSESLTLEDLEKDVTNDTKSFTATWHFGFDDILKAIEHMDQEPEPELITDLEPEGEPENETLAQAEPEPEAVVESESETDTVTEPELDPAVETGAAAESEEETETDSEIESADELEAQEITGETDKTDQNLQPQHRVQNAGTKKLLLTVCILFVVIAASIVAGLAVANSIVDKANVANEEKIAEMKANIKEVNLADSLYKIAANEVVEDVAVPTYTLDELYAMDLREPTGFTAKDLEMITRKGLVGCEEAFVKAEKTYGVNSIFLMSIASLESAYGTMMFRPNNMFGYGRTGFSSKQEGIMTVAKGLGTRYLPPGGSLYGGSPTLKGVNKRYAANPQWYYKVGKYMQGYYEELAAEKNGALDKFE